MVTRSQSNAPRISTRMRREPDISPIDHSVAYRQHCLLIISPIEEAVWPPALQSYRAGLSMASQCNSLNVQETS